MTDRIRFARRRRATGTLAAVALGLLVAIGMGAAPAAADADDFTFDAFHADMTLGRAADGHSTLSVTETIVARFPDDDQNRGIIRAIPDDAAGVPMRTEITGVTGEGGTPIPYEVTRSGDMIEVATGDDTYVHGPQTYVISYTQRDVVRPYADTGVDEFFRDINGTGWEQPFGSVSATIAVAPEVASALTGDAACYVGASGATDTCDLTGSDPAVFLPQASDLEPEETMTVAIAFAPGTFVPGEVVLSAGEQFALAAAPTLTGVSIGAFALAAAALVLAALARRRAADAPGRGIIVAQYDAPADLPVVEAAHLVRRPATAVAAAIIDLAVRGSIRIVAPPEGEEPVLEFVRRADDPARQDVMDALFGSAPSPGDRVGLGREHPERAKRLLAVAASGAGGLRRRGLTAVPPRRLGVVGIVLAVGSVVAALVALVFLSIAATAGALIGAAPPGWTLVVAIIALVATAVAAVLAFLLFPWRDRLTDAGAAVRDHLRGLRDYLELAEGDRIRMLQSPEGAERDAADVLHLYERLLPYAVIWRVERQWAAVLAARVAETDTTPAWYTGRGPFTGAYLAITLSSLQQNTSAAVAVSSTAGSTSGGSLGGGFAGGGFGGGGGGGR